jgi:hypothetical protein
MNDNIIPFGRPTDNTPHDIDVRDLLDAIQAKKIASGVTLMTKDGRTTGNAIVIGQTGNTRKWKDPKSTKEVEPVWLIETDFGNRAQLSTSEINEWFHLGYQRSYDEWRLARIDCIAGTKEHEKETNT